MQLTQRWLDDLRGVIDKFATFVARNGPDFERITKEKQANNPKFTFLFGGPFHQYYLWVNAFYPH